MKKPANLPASKQISIGIVLSVKKELFPFVFYLVLVICYLNPSSLNAQTEQSQDLTILCFEAESSDENYYFFITLNIDEKTGSLNGVLAVNDTEDIVSMVNFSGRADFERDELTFIDETGTQQLWKVYKEGILSPEGQYFSLTDCDDD